MQLARIALAAVVCLGLTACSGDGDGTPSAGASAGSLDCTTQLTATYPDGSSVDLDGGTAAVQLGDGTGYTVYATDYDLPTAGIGTATVRPPSGKHLASVFLAPVDPEGAQPITAGTEVEAGGEGPLGFGVILYAGEDDFGTAAAASGSITLTGLTSDRLCLDLDYRDDQKSLTGTIAADVFDSPF